VEVFFLTSCSLKMVKIGMFAKRSAGLKMKLNRKDITTAFRTFDDRIGELIKLKSMARREVAAFLHIA